ncbi:relaxase/mobilization nuclease domain-containing protein [Psychrobacter sp. APC 3279]|nr:relaxase/mobilization nuclease domain-containing protein [Psychrobacter sp. APC 3279]MDN3442655.1 relaxase/mobilization nuclease domain-containing protein [Psychrobacter sp. APC 3279]
MIVKFFTRGTGGSKGVFDYLLKDKEQPDGKRIGAEVLRGDIDNQALLIDSLDFKQKYTSGCLSFTETADEVTQSQKNALMDSFEQTIRSGLDVDRVSVSWIEHRDKGRLELNFVFANVDLEHGRAFQPYVHNVDKRRVNAWKDMQNIEHGFTDPNDPANKRLMAQRDNLPRDVKEVRQAITDGLKTLVVEGVITNRDDVIQALTDGGFEIARETDKAISIKNPAGKRNIRLTGGLYERDFNFSSEVQNTIERTGEDYRARSTERYDAAKQLYDSEIDRKRNYHQARHGKPRHQQRAIANNVSKASNRYVYSPRNLYEQRPSPYHRAFKPVRRRDGKDDRSLHTAHQTTDNAARRQNSAGHQVRNEKMADSYQFWRTHGIGVGHAHRGSVGQQVLKTDLYQFTAAATVTTADRLQSEVSHGQETTRASTASPTSSAGHDQTSRADARRPRAIHTAAATQEKPRYSRIDSLIEQIGADEDARAGTIADVVQAVERFNDRTNKRVQWLGTASETARNNASNVDKRVAGIRKRTDAARSAIEGVSEHDNTARLSKERYDAIRERYREVRGRIEGISERTDQNRAITNENNRLTGRNAEGSEGIKQVAEQVREVIKVKEQELERARAPTRSRSPSMGR